MLLAFGVTTPAVGRRDLTLAKFDLWGVPFHAESSVEFGGRHVYTWSLFALIRNSNRPMCRESALREHVLPRYTNVLRDKLTRRSRIMFNLVNSCADLSWALSVICYIVEYLPRCPRWTGWSLAGHINIRSL